MDNLTVGYTECNLYMYITNTTGYNSAPNDDSKIEYSSTVISSLSLGVGWASHAFTFSGNTYLSSSNYYVFVVFADNGTVLDSNHRISMGVGGSYAGYRDLYSNSAWGAPNTADFVFYVYGVNSPAPTPTPTPVPATTVIGYQLTPIMIQNYYDWGVTETGTQGAVYSLRTYFGSNSTTTSAFTYRIYGTQVFNKYNSDGTSTGKTITTTKDELLAENLTLLTSGTGTMSDYGEFTKTFIPNYSFNSSENYYGLKVNVTITDTSQQLSYWFIIIGNEPDISYSAYFKGGTYDGWLTDNVDYANPDIGLALQQGTDYLYTGYLFRNNALLEINGTYTIETSGIYDSITRFHNPVMTTSQTGSVVNGKFSFYISCAIMPFDAFQVLSVNFVVSNASESYTSTDYIYNLIYYAPASTNNPQPTGLTTQPLISASLMGALILIIIFALVFGYFAGKEGILAGIILGIFISSLSGLLPIYSILLCIILGAILVVSNTGIGRGGTPN